MRNPWSWVRAVYAQGMSAAATRASSGGQREVISLLVPAAARGLHPALRVVVAGATALGLVGAGALGVVSLAGLLCALAIFYFLSREVLGLEIDVDPRAFYERVQRQAAAYGPN